jgi:hypothetical protein
VKTPVEHFQGVLAFGEREFAGFLSALRRGELYVVVATASHPEGEIRGQIAASR